MLRLFLEDEGASKDKKKKLEMKDADIETSARQKPYIVALSLQEVWTLAFKSDIQYRPNRCVV